MKPATKQKPRNELENLRVYDLFTMAKRLGYELSISFHPVHKVTDVSQRAKKTTKSKASPK